MSALVESLLTQILEEQRKTNDLLALLIQALADEVEADDASAATKYLDGSTI